MQHFVRTFLAASITSALFASYAHANANQGDSVQEMPTADQCLIENSDTDINTMPVVIEADSLQAVNGDKAQYLGDVEVTQGNKKITAESVTLHEKENTVVAEGNVTFNDGQVKALSSRVTSNIAEDTFSLENTQYQFICQQGRGEAAYIAKTGQSMYYLDDGSITSCPEGDNAWRLVADGIEIDQEEEMATLYHSRFEVLDVPVFYFPYITVPVGESRKTGFLFPTISYGSSDGIETEIPFYWNIAPNYDMTITTNWLQKRGTKLDTDFRYLTNGWGEGEIKGEYMYNDRKYNDESRWGFQYLHEGIIDENWVVDIDYSKVSDNDYFIDFSSDIGKREDGQLIQEGSLQYRENNWDMTLRVRDFQVLVNSEAYRILPQLEANYYVPLWRDWLHFDTKAQITRFDIEDESQPDATRAHIEPGLTIPLSNSWGFWTSEARVLATYYKQELNDVDPSKGFEEEVNRVLPEFRSHAGVYLERDTSLFEGYTQSLEPQIQYLYVPEEDQNNIANYDTTLLQTDYYGLFRSRKYSSIDKIAAANQLSYGASTRFFDDSYKERLNISFGQIFYFDKDNKLTNSSAPSKKTSLSSWAIETDFNYEDYLFYHGGIQYDVDQSSVQFANSNIEYRYSKGFVQANYRYVTKEYIEETIEFEDLDLVTRDGISQAGLLGSYELNNNWSTSAQYYHDLTEDIPLEWQVNLLYQSDCWYMGVSYSSQLEGWDNELIGAPNNSANYESNFGIRFGIQGFATSQRYVTAEDEIDSGDNAIEYGRPFNLNN